jgi:hypothetical protein
MAFERLKLFQVSSFHHQPLASPQRQRCGRRVNNALDRQNINKTAHPLVGECHACQNGALIAGTDKNIHAAILTIDPKRLDPNTAVMRF